MVFAKGDDVDANLIGQNGLIDHIPDGLRMRNDIAISPSRQVSKGVDPELNAHLELLTIVPQQALMVSLRP
ncbi:MAG: hypothetical protein Devi2KO_39180 [Devosia indica]